MRGLKSPMMKLHGIKRDTLAPFILLLCSRHHKKEISQLSHTQWWETRLLRRPGDCKFNKLRKLHLLWAEYPDDVSSGRTDFRLMKWTSHWNGLLLPIIILLSFLTEPRRFKTSPRLLSVSPFQILNHTVTVSFLLNSYVTQRDVF
jgi:hypothetical protein